MVDADAAVLARVRVAGIVGLSGGGDDGRGAELAGEASWADAGALAVVVVLADSTVLARIRVAWVNRGLAISKNDYFIFIFCFQFNLCKG